MGSTTLRNLIGTIGWKMYVWGHWYHNKNISDKLTLDVCENLGVYLRESHPDFK